MILYFISLTNISQFSKDDEVQKKSESILTLAKSSVKSSSLNQTSTEEEIKIDNTIRDTVSDLVTVETDK